MNEQERNQIYEAEKNGWKFTHLSGSRMTASNGIISHIVPAPTSVTGYKSLLELIK